MTRGNDRLYAPRALSPPIVLKLDTGFFAARQKDLEIIDSCLVDDDGPGCSEFVDAMIALRELWDGSPGNA